LVAIVSASQKHGAKRESQKNIEEGSC